MEGRGGGGAGKPKGEWEGVRRRGHLQMEVGVVLELFRHFPHPSEHGKTLPGNSQVRQRCCLAGQVIIPPSLRPVILLIWKGQPMYGRRRTAGKLRTFHLRFSRILPSVSV